ncbi:MAG TPA: hypothetical protein VFN30_05845 [Chitinophagaceae bacterium]|jgi:hypothetical protein|nr:hypothetical protein [Chitinophagaceae bacterium]
MKSIERIEIYDAAPGDVFKFIDNLGVTGMHMTKSSWMMIGSKLKLDYLTEQHNGPGTKYRWTGKMMGIKMDFTVEVTQWIEGKEKIWETVGKAKMIIYSWFQMHLTTAPMFNKGTKAELSITYKKPKGLLNNILCFLFADWYCKWCLKQMLGDAKKSLNAMKSSSQFIKSDENEIN